jgi:hypothetical protein
MGEISSNFRKLCGSPLSIEQRITLFRDLAQTMPNAAPQRTMLELPQHFGILSVTLVTVPGNEPFAP